VGIVRQYNHVPVIYGYAAEMSQVFMHLIRNAAQAIEGAGAITVTADCDSEQIRIVVADSGRGIASEDIEKLFNPGFNLQDRRIRASLSLFTCLTIVRKHGGDIEVDSTPGKGSTFCVVLPRALEHAPLTAAIA
jgi:signal transduction histidine kinase